MQDDFLITIAKARTKIVLIKTELHCSCSSLFEKQESSTIEGGLITDMAIIQKIEPNVSRH